MALSEKHRSSIYRKFVPILGEEEAQALVSQFPATDLEIPATKDFVRAEIAGLRAEISELRAETHDLLRRQTAWTIGALTGVMIAVTTVAQLLD